MITGKGELTVTKNTCAEYQNVFKDILNFDFFKWVAVQNFISQNLLMNPWTKFGGQKYSVLDTDHFKTNFKYMFIYFMATKMAAAL